MKYLGTITSGLDLVNKNYVDDNVPTKTSDLTNDSGFSSVSFTRYTTSGTNIADIEIDGTTTKIYAPSSGGGGVTDYDQLTSRPQINSTTLTGDKSSSDLGLADEVHTHTKSDITDFPTIPSKTSDLTNDSGYITTETDPTVPSWAKANNKPTYMASEITNAMYKSGAYLPAEGEPPYAYGVYGLASGSEVKIPVYKSYSQITHQSDIVNKQYVDETVPTKTSDLTNDSGFVSGLMFEEKSIKDNVTVNGSGTKYTDGNASIAKTGYTPLGVVGFRVINASSSGANGANVVISHAYISGTTAYFRVKNTETSSAKVRIYFTILYAKA
jgi:hypothetical protein